MKTPSHAVAPSLSLLAANEPSALIVERPEGAADIVFICDHAGSLIPRSLGTLGASDADLVSPAAVDIGVAGLASALAERLDATLVMQAYSRLVIDCDRAPDAADAIAQRGEWHAIPGNESLDESAVLSRLDAVFHPYHEGLAELISQRQAKGRRTLLIALQSFPATWRSQTFEWQIGVTYGDDTRLAETLLRLLRRDERLVVGDNEPHIAEAGEPYTLQRHATPQHLPQATLHLRQDLIADVAMQKNWAGRLANMLKQASAQLS